MLVQIGKCERLFAALSFQEGSTEENFSVVSASPGKSLAEGLRPILDHWQENTRNGCSEDETITQPKAPRFNQKGGHMHCLQKLSDGS